MSGFLGVREKQKRLVTFTANGTWVVPAGVTYAVAHVLGGGGGAGRPTATNGANSSVAFASGTVTGRGGLNFQLGTGFAFRNAAGAGRDNSGKSAWYMGMRSAVSSYLDETNGVLCDGELVVQGREVVPGASVSVTVGAGGSAGAGGAAGGSGLVYIEYYE